MKPAYRIDGLQVEPAAFYAAACNPERPVIVEACAGAGKTWMLVSRILRALVAGTPPQEILALTFTRKAAGEMRARLQAWLEEFAAPVPLDDVQAARLSEALVARGLDPQAAQAAAPGLAQLRERLLAQGRRVEIRGIQSWFAQLLTAAPMEILAELGLPFEPQFLEDRSDLMPALFERFHAAVDADEGLRALYLGLVREHRVSGVQGLLEAALDRRVEFEQAAAAGVLADSIAAPAALWPECAGLDDPRERLLEKQWFDHFSGLAERLADHKNKLARDSAGRIADGLDSLDPVERHASWRQALLTKDLTLRKALGNDAGLAPAAELLLALEDQIAQHEARRTHLRLLPLVQTLLDAWRELKRCRGLVDMDDLDRAAAHLLSDPVHAGALLSRLDTRIRHLLIDEFQDTSPTQWQGLKAWLEGYAGAGGGGHGRLSVFIVGDPKQSIYRFRRAEPRVFAAARRFIVEAFDGALLECDHTRRCAPEVIAAVNAVFAEVEQQAPWADFRPHSTGAVDEGRVLRLAEPEGGAPAPDAKGGTAAAPATPFWRDSLTEPRVEPEVLREAAECQRVAQALLAMLSAGRAPREIMVLARKRASLSVLAEHLAAAGVPFVMPEPVAVGEEPEARDLLALLDVLASPTQDLSLARALRSPLFGIGDDDLLAIAHAREAGSHPHWWAALLDPACGGSAALDRARHLLQRWADDFNWLPPHDLLDRIVHEGDFMARLAAAVPPARRVVAATVVEALLRAALELDQGRCASPYRFVRALKARAVKVKIAPAADAVALLTVHGAKGLEAPAVIVLATDGGVPAARGVGVLVDWPVDTQAPLRMALLMRRGAPPPSLQTLAREDDAARGREELNALYVAMTRAGQELVFSRTVPKRRPTETTWWERLQERTSPWLPLPGPADGALAPDAPWVPDDPRVGPPSGAGAAPSPRSVPADARAALVGITLHRALQWLAPTHAGAAAPRQAIGALVRRAAAEAAGPSAGAAAVEALAAIVSARVEAILSAPSLRRFFDPQELAWAGNEVAIDLDGRMGRIDRLVAFERAAGRREWWVLDYKLATTPDAAPAHRSQVLAYVAALARLQPGDRIRAALIGGDGSLHPVGAS